MAQSDLTTREKCGEGTEGILVMRKLFDKTLGLIKKKMWTYCYVVRPTITYASGVLANNIAKYSKEQIAEGWKKGAFCVM